MSQSPIELHIDELVLTGFPPEQRHLIAAAVEHELTRLLAERGLPAQLTTDAAQVDAGAFTAAPGAGPRQVGAQVARSLYSSLGR